LEVVGNKTPTYPAVLRGFQPPPREELYQKKFFPRGKLFAELVGGFNLPNPDLSGPKGRNFCHNKLSPFLKGVALPTTSQILPNPPLLVNHPYPLFEKRGEKCVSKPLLFQRRGWG